MQRFQINKAEFISALAVMLLGTLLHFAYNFSGQNFIIALFAPVNESVWEHLKLVFFPVFFVTCCASLFYAGKNLPVFYAHAVSVLSGMLFLIIFYYTYSGVWGHSVTFIDIALYYVTVSLVYVLAAAIMRRERNVVPYALPGICIFVVMSGIFFLFTLYPPDIGIFTPPVP